MLQDIIANPFPLKDKKYGRIACAISKKGLRISTLAKSSFLYY